MRISGVHVHGFGLLADLEVDGFGPGTTVVLGPNEAGKSTLHTFLVRTLFGHPRSNDARERVRHEPLRGGRHGGVVWVRDGDGADWEIHRYTTGATRLRVVGPDGADVDTAPALEALLGRGMDEDRYEQVHAIDLDALAGLGALRGAALDELLLDAATVGAGRSLRRAVAALEQRRDALWLPRGSKPPLNAAMQERRKAAAGLREATARAGAHRAARDEVTRLEVALEANRDDQARLQAEVRQLERLQELWPTWQERREALDRRDAAGGTVVPEALAAEVEELTRQHDAARAEATRAHDEAEALAARAASIPVDVALHAVAAEVEAHAGSLALQQDRRGRLEAVAEVHRAAQRAVEEALRPLPAGWAEARVAATPEDATLAPAVRAAVERIRQAEQHLAARTEAVDAERARHQELAVVAAAAERDLSPEPADDVRARQAAVAMLRAALPDLERAEDPDRPGAGSPAWVPFVSAAVTLLIAAAAVVAAVSGAIAVAAVAAVGALLAGLVTFALRPQRTAASDGRGTGPAGATGSANDLRRQVEVAAATLGLALPVTRQALEEADLATDEHAERRRRWLAARDAATGAVRELERQAALLAEATGRAEGAEEALATAMADWAEVTRRAGLEGDTDPAGAPELLTAIAEVRRALVGRERAAREEAELTEQIAAVDRTSAALCVAAGRDPGEPPDAALQRLAADVQADAAARTEVARLEAEAAERRQAADDAEARAGQLGGSLAAAHAQLGAVDAAAFADLLARDTERRAAEEDLAAADRRLQQALGADERAAQLRAELATGRVTTWADSLAERRAELATLDGERDDLVRAHTTALQELRAIGEDDAVMRAASEVAQHTERCQELAERWATADLAARLLATTLERFERAHQPTVLERAGGLLAEATVGRWTHVRRIEDELHVAHDVTLVPARALSRGATEQLYLCLRLALAEELGAGGAALPLLIDDLMANADPERADGLARILADVATRHQLLLFTCDPVTSERVVAADGDAGVLELAAGGTGATWRSLPGG